MTERLDQPDDLPLLDIGDHVEDRDEPDATLIVVGTPLKRAASVEIDDDGTTVADVNPGYPETDPIVEVVYPGSTATDIDTLPRYAFPRRRLRRVRPVHSDDEDEAAADAEITQGPGGDWDPTERERVVWDGDGGSVHDGGRDA